MSGVGERVASAAPDGPVSGSPLSPGIAAPKDLNVETLADDLGSTDAIDFTTKLGLNSELDSLIEAFREYHDGSGGPSLAALYGRFDRLLETTLALTEENDPMLYRKLKRSRPRLWRILIDRAAFLDATDESDAVVLKDSARE